MKNVRPPCIRMDAQKPDGMKFKPTDSALARFDKAISAAAKDSGEAEIEILGDIGETYWTENFTTAKMVKDQLKELGPKPVLVTINSPGGDAFEGIAIYNLLREHKGKVTVNVIGMAASAASVIAMAGEQVIMGEAAFMMIHSSSGVVVGNQADMREFADTLNAIDQSVANLYATRSGMPKDDVLALMQKETWLTAEDAVDKGFADVQNERAKARAELPAMPAYQRSTDSVVRLSASDLPKPSKPPSNRKPGVVYLK